MIILIGAEKGGTGKTTLATSLAAMRTNEGHDVLLLDTDQQGTATYWNRLRDQTEAKKITCVQVFGEVDREIRKLASKYDEIIIDAGGRDSEELRSSILVAHKIYIPLQPSQFDIWTITQMAKIVERGKTFNQEPTGLCLAQSGFYSPLRQRNRRSPGNHKRAPVLSIYSFRQWSSRRETPFRKRPARDSALRNWKTKATRWRK